MKQTKLQSKYFLTILVFLLSYTQLKAQNQINISQYMLYQPFLNPSAAGTYNELSLGIIHRNQWTGFDGAPTTNMLSLNSPINKSNLFLGLGFQQERIGILNGSNIHSNIAYRFKLSKESYLSFGISLGLNMFNLNYSELKNSKNDIELSQGKNATGLNSPLAKFGVYYFRNRFYATVYVPNIINPRFLDEGETIKVENTFDAKELHYYGQVGYGFDITNNVAMNASTLLKSSSKFQYDLNLQFVFNDLFGIGASYRSSEEIVGLMNIKLFEKLTIGYAYDYALSGLSNVSSGSHEVIATFNFKKKFSKADIQIPRF